MKEVKECQTCHKEYLYFHKNDKHCHTCKTYKKVREANQKWVNKVKVEGSRGKISSDLFGYKFFRKKYSTPNNVFRG